MSIVTTDEVRAVAPNELNDEDLQAVIDREETALAVVVGPLVGPRTKTVYPSRVPDTITGTIALGRHASTLPTVTDATLSVDAATLRLVRDGWAIRRPGWPWTGPVAITWTPDDRAVVEAAIIDLVALRITPMGGYQSETIGGYSYSRAQAGSLARQRQRIIRTILEPARPGTIRIRGASRSDDRLPVP